MNEILKAGSKAGREFLLLFSEKRRKVYLVKRKNYISPTYPHFLSKFIKGLQIKLNYALFTMSL
jgi:hypothetical protein